MMRGMALVAVVVALTTLAACGSGDEGKDRVGPHACVPYWNAPYLALDQVLAQLESPPGPGGAWAKTVRQREVFDALMALRTELDRDVGESSDASTWQDLAGGYSASDDDRGTIVTSANAIVLGLRADGDNTSKGPNPHVPGYSTPGWAGNSDTNRPGYNGVAYAKLHNLAGRVRTALGADSH